MSGTACETSSFDSSVPWPPATADTFLVCSRMHRTKYQYLHESRVCGRQIEPMVPAGSVQANRGTEFAADSGEVVLYRRILASERSLLQTTIATFRLIEALPLTTL